MSSKTTSSRPTPDDLTVTLMTLLVPLDSQVALSVGRVCPVGGKIVAQDCSSTGSKSFA